MAHLNFVGYINISEIFVAQEIEENKIPKIVVSINAKKMKHNNSKIRERPEGEYPS